MKKELKSVFLILLILFSILPSISVFVLSDSSNTVNATYEWDTGGIITVNGTQSAGFTLFSDPSGARTMLFSESITNGLAEVVWADLENGDYEALFGWTINDVYGMAGSEDDLSGTNPVLFTISDNGTLAIANVLVKPDPPVLTEYGEDNKIL